MSQGEGSRTAPPTSAPVREALEGATGALEASGIEGPGLDAELLLREATGWSRAKLATDRDAPLPPGASRLFGEMVRRRARREPVAYILGRKGFRHIELEVDDRVLIPRPETELLVEIALELEPDRLLEVGTGSGAVALAIADELSEAEVFATDASPDALSVAWSNTRRLNFGRRVHLAVGSVPLDADPFDLLVANLPYVTEEEWDRLAPEIREFEPRQALVPGPTGLEVIELVLGEVASIAQRPSAVALEIGAGQHEQVSALVRRAGYGRVETRSDLAGIERVVLGR